MSNFSKKHLAACNREYWETTAETNPYSEVRAGWSEEDFNIRNDETVLNLFNFNLNKKDTFVDLGCGVGYVCKIASPVVGMYIGIDFSEKLINIARARNKFDNINFIVNDGKTIPLANNSVDVLISEQMFQHVVEDQITGKLSALNYIKEIQRITKPDSRICIQLPRKAAYVHYGFFDNEIEDLKSLFNACEIYVLDPWYYHLCNNLTKNDVPMWKTATL